MAGQYQNLVNKQYNSPIKLYSDRSVREILERQTKVLENGAIGIDFNSPMANKPASLQNSAVLRMLEEEENRKRSGQPGSVKRVAWPPPRDSESEDYIEQEPVHSQGGPLFSSKSVSPGLENNQVPSPQPQPQLQSPYPSQPQAQPQQAPTQQQPASSPQIQQQPARPWLPQQSQTSKSPTVTIGTSNATFQPILSPASPLYSNSSAPLSPSISRSPVSFTGLAKPWSPQSQWASNFKPVQPPSLRTIKTYEKTSEQYHYQSQGRIQGDTITLPPYQPVQETVFQQYQTPVATPVVETRRAPQGVNQNGLEEISSTQASFKSPKTEQSASIAIQREVPNSPVKTLPKVLPDFSQSTTSATLLKIAPTTIKQSVAPLPNQSQTPPGTAAKGVAQNQTPPLQRYQQPAKQVEPPPSTIILRPQAPVSQAPPPLVTSQPATATLRGGKNLRGDLKWPPEDVRERMAAERQHLIELQKGPACKPRKQCKDYSPFFAKHALTHAYPGYKIPPGTQFYDHNPVM